MTTFLVIRLRNGLYAQDEKCACGVYTWRCIFHLVESVYILCGDKIMPAPTYLAVAALDKFQNDIRHLGVKASFPEEVYGKDVESKILLALSSETEGRVSEILEKRGYMRQMQIQDICSICSYYGAGDVDGSSDNGA